MASFDLGNKLSLAYSIVPAATTANTVGGAVDTQGFEAVCAFGLSQAITALDAEQLLHVDFERRRHRCRGERYGSSRFSYCFEYG
jgi:hypothetical protein